MRRKWAHIGCKGYSWDKQHKSFVAEICIEGRKYRRFASTEEEAVRLRNRLELFRDGHIRLEEV